MARLRELKAHLLTDRRITADEIPSIRQYLESNGRLDIDDVSFLVQLLSESVEVCPEFDALFFPVLRSVLLEDGRIGLDEQFHLLKMLYSNGHVRPAEKDFLRDLQCSVEEVTPEFQMLCETAFASAEKNWDVGGS